MVSAFHKYQQHERKTEDMFLVKETKEIWQINGLCGPELDPGPEIFFFTLQNISKINGDRVHRFDKSTGSVLFSDNVSTTRSTCPVYSADPRRWGYTEHSCLNPATVFHSNR